MLEVKIIYECNPSGYKDGCIIYEIKTNIKNIDILKNELLKKGFYTNNEGVFWALKQFEYMELKEVKSDIYIYNLRYSIPTTN